jgi:hypothetical protein
MRISHAKNAKACATRETAAKQGEKILIDARGSGLSAEQAANQIARAQGNVGNLTGRVTVLTKDGVVKF